MPICEYTRFYRAIDYVSDGFFSSWFTAPDHGQFSSAFQFNYDATLSLPNAVNTPEPFASGSAVTTDMLDSMNSQFNMPSFAGVDNDVLAQFTQVYGEFEDTQEYQLPPCSE